jgi:phosphopantothenoylcysteine decarboxylase/phosphopantothenate--cysteine ligase
MDLSGKTIIAGICGGIAAFKVAGIVSKLHQAGAEVHVVMTEAATKFVGPLTFEALSHNPVLTNLFRDEPLSHVNLAHKADLVVVMPATYNTIGKVSQGIADDYLTTILSVASAPVLFIPAMESQMYENAIFEENIRTRLLNLGHHLMEPESGNLASGRSGVGRFPAEEKVLIKIEEMLTLRELLKGKKLLITAGPTRERIDPMRVITNRSSGKMGYALAEAARDFGADQVILISGPTQLKIPHGIELIETESAQDMREAVIERAEAVDVIVMSAAVADWRPTQISETKESKLSSDTMSIEFERTPDILMDLKEILNQAREKPLIIGFAAETNDLLEKAKGKLKRKNLDLIVANDLTQEGAGAEVDTNIATLVYKDGANEELPKMTKKELAKRIILAIAGL